MTCRCSPSLLSLRDQLDAAHPHRSTAADGCCGDARHRREVSDHNPVGGYAHAFDITQDPAHGVDCNLLAVSLIGDPRMKYVIWNRRIYDPSVSRTWRRYRGTDPHTGHLHLSILLSATHDTRPWPIKSAPAAPQPAPHEEDDMALSNAITMTDGPDPHAVFVLAPDYTESRNGQLRWRHVSGPRLATYRAARLVGPETTPMTQDEAYDFARPGADLG